MQDVILERERTDDGIVLHFVVHLVSILDVDSGASDVVEHFFFNGQRMGAVDDNSPLMASLDVIVLEYTSGTIVKFVETKAVLSFDA